MNSDKNPNPNPKPASSPILDRFSARLKEREQQLGRCKTLDIVSLYEDVLVELTTNSKPVITDLSIIADQQKEHAEGIANAICDRILKVAMEKKLPSLYLLDSIVKNVGCEYKSLFASRLYEVFVVTYRQLHPSFHPSMLRLFKTWPLYFPASVLSKIEAELQFTLQEYQNQSCSSYSGQSGSQSSRLVHSIHVNPMYLDKCHQSEHSGVDAQHARHPPSLQSHRQKSSLQLRECNLDHHEVHPPIPRFERTGTVGMAGVKDMLSYSRPSSPPRVWSTIDSFPERVVSRPSLSSTGAGKPNDWSGGLERSGPSGDSVQIPEASGAHNHNNGYDKLRARLLIEAYGSEDASSEKLPKFQRLDFNGTSSNITTKDLRSSEEEYAWECMSPTLSNQSKQYKPTPFGHVAGLTRVNTACVGKEFRSDWHNQASLARSDDRANVIANSGHRSFSNKCQNDLASHKEQWTRYQQIYHAQEPLKFSSDLPQSSQQITHSRPQGKMLQVPRSENGMIPIGQKTTTTSPFNDARHLSFDDACQAEVRFNRISNSCSESLKCEASIIERHLAEKGNSPHSASVLWPPIRKSQPLPLFTVPSHEQQFKSSFDSEANKPIANVTPDPPLFLHRQQFDTDDKTTSLNVQSLEQRTNVPLEYREAQSLSGPVEPSLLSLHLVPHSSSHVQEQGGVVPLVLPNLPCGLAFPNPPLQPPLCSSHSLHLHPLRPVSTTTAISAAAPLPYPVSFPLPHPLRNPIHPAASLTHICTSTYPLPNLSFPLTAQNNSISFMYQPSGPLPPLPLGPPPASLQRGPDSQRTTAVVSESPASAYSGLISSLMAQGLISLIPLNPSQDAVRIDFNAELLKVRHESSINSLYGDLSRQCTTCGMRFKCQEEHSSHMDWHVTKNRIAKNHKQKPSRNWYVNEKEWLSGAEALGTDVMPGLFLTEAVVEKKKDKEVAVPADENQPTCALCGEPFEDFYSDEMEEWLYRGAVYLNAPNGLLEGIERSKLGPIVHAKCQPESAVNS